MKYLRAEDVARLLGIEKATLYAYRGRGTAPPTALERCPTCHTRLPLWTEEDIEKWRKK